MLICSRLSQRQWVVLSSALFLVCGLNNRDCLNISVLHLFLYCLVDFHRLSCCMSCWISTIALSSTPRPAELTPLLWHVNLVLLNVHHCFVMYTLSCWMYLFALSCTPCPVECTPLLCHVHHVFFGIYIFALSCTPCLVECTSLLCHVWLSQYSSQYNVCLRSVLSWWIVF